MTPPAGIDPRGPRFAATIMTVLLLTALLLSLIGISTAQAGADSWTIRTVPLVQRAFDAGFTLLVIVALLFLWGVLSPPTAPWGVLFRRVIRPRLAPPPALEDPRPPRFAQGVGLFVVTIGLVLHLAGVPWALPAAAAAAFIAAFLNAAFNLCLGCQLYLLLQRAGIFGRTAGPA